MALLRARLSDWGYGERYRGAVLGPGEPGPFARDPAAALARIGSLQPDDAAALELLALGRSVAARALPRWGPDVVAALARAGLVQEMDGGLWQTAGWVAVAFGAAALLADRPRAYGGDEVRVYLGPDSVMLAASLPQEAGLRVLDIGAGCGVQGLLGVPAPAEAALVDIEPRAVRYCALNAELCGRTDAVRCLLGDMYEPVAGERFDLIVSLPPYVPVPSGVPYSGVANGGRDGLAVLRDLLAGAADHLVPGGRLVALCQLLVGSEGPLLLRELPEIAPRLECSLDVFARAPASSLAAELAEGLASRVEGWSGDRLADAYAREFRDLGAVEVHGCVLRAAARRAAD
jgi:SAM-dependent methyltransferase